MRDGSVVIGIDLDTKGFDLEIEATKEELDSLIEEYKILKKAKPYEGQNRDLLKLQQEIEKTRNKYVVLREKQEELNSQNFSGLKNSMSGIGETMSSLIKKVTKWGLALFGVRSAYMFIRRSMSTLSQYNDQMATDVQYITFALATTLKPIIEAIINLVYKLLAYINYVAYAWFKVNLFANASVNSFNKANKSANALRKTLLGFDEMNIIGKENENYSGGILPSFDLSKLEDIEIPDWVKWIADHKELFEVLGGILLVAFGANTIHTVLGNLATLFGVGASIGLVPLLEILALIAAPIVIYFTAKGIAEIIKQTSKLNDMIKENTKLSDSSKKSQKEYTDTLIEKIRANELDNEQIQDSTRFLLQHTSQQHKMIKATQEQETWLTRLTGSTKEAKKQYEDMRDELIYNIDAWNELTKAGKTTEEQQKEFNLQIWENINALEKNGIDVTELKNKYDTLNGTKVTVTVNAQTSTAKSSLERILELLDKIFNTKWKFQGNFSLPTGTAGGGGGGHGFAKGGIAYNSLPRLSAGAILNQPGRGVQYGDAIVAERGAEAILPLTDTAQMELLGETIGKYIVINANITNKMNGRIISRELQKVQNESNFASNR